MASRPKAAPPHVASQAAFGSLRGDADESRRDVPLVERVFGLRLDPMAGAVLILRVPDTASFVELRSDDEDVPAWYNVLVRMSDEDLADFNVTPTPA